MSAIKADIHILTIPDRVLWLNDTIGSLQQQPCNIYLHPGIIGNTGSARYEAFQLGSAPYVGYADDDDLVEPGAVQACINVLEANPKAVGVFTDEVLIDHAGKIIGKGSSTGNDWTPKRHLGSLKFVHHLWLGRRESVNRHKAIMQNMPIGAHWALTCLMALDGPWIHLPIVGYQWRIHPQGAHNLRRPPEGSLREIATNIRQQWNAAGVLV